MLKCCKQLLIRYCSLTDKLAATQKLKKYSSKFHRNQIQEDNIWQKEYCLGEQRAEGGGVDEVLPIFMVML